jgi:predicted enzyme related to lactoylglutathione lyase
MARTDKHISYVEFCASDLAETKRFYGAVFGWAFKDWGDDYIDFKGATIDGGFRREEAPATGGTLVVLYAEDLAAVQRKVEAEGGTISKAIFPFPGGRRFHFLDPSGNELGVWSDK